jgi:hypothetical protein
MSHSKKKVKLSEPEDSSSEYLPSDESSESDEYEEQEIKVSQKPEESDESDESDESEQENSEEPDDESEQENSENDDAYQKMIKAFNDSSEKHFASYDGNDLPFQMILVVKELSKYVLRNGCYPDDTEIAYFRCLRDKYINRKILSERQHMRFAAIPLWKEYIELYQSYQKNNTSEHRQDFSVRNIISNSSKIPTKLITKQRN